MDTVFIGARGSGEDGTTDYGLGPEVDNALTAFNSVAGARGLTVGYYALGFGQDTPNQSINGSNYVAAPATDLVTDNSAFWASITSGVDSVLQFIKARSAKCSNETYVLAGYSQGAMVMHRALDMIAADTGKAAGLKSLLNRLTGVVLIADGDRLSGEGGTAYGTATGGWGVSYWGPGGETWPYGAGDTTGYLANPESISSIAGWPSGRFYSVCQAEDFICDFSYSELEAGKDWIREEVIDGDLTPIAVAVTFTTDALHGMDIHGRAYRPGGPSSTYVQAAARAAAGTTISVVNDTLMISGATTPLTIAQPATIPLSVDGGSGPYTWSAQGLPAGMSIDPNTGLISGTPTTEPPFTRVRVTTPSGAIGTRLLHFSYGRQAGTLYSWGDNNAGQLGQPGSPGTATPTPILTNAIDVAGDNSELESSSGSQSNVAPFIGDGLTVRSDGTVWAWGNNEFGQAGVDAAASPTVAAPTQVHGLSNIVQVAAGSGTSYALGADGTVWAWGLNNAGQLGDGTSTNSFTPHQVLGLDNITQIAAGMSTAYALRADGTSWAWGADKWGSAGVPVSSPDSHGALAVPAAQIGAGDSEVSGTFSTGFVLTATGAANTGSDLIPAGAACSFGGYSWPGSYPPSGAQGPYGSNACPAGIYATDVGSGGYSTSPTSPLQRPPLSGFADLEAAGSAEYGLTTDGQIYGWGYTGQAVLIGGANLTPGMAVVPFGPAQSIAANTRAVYALLPDGTVRAWGGGDAADILGDGVEGYHNTAESDPVTVKALAGTIQIAATVECGYAIAVPQDTDLAIAQAANVTVDATGPSGATVTYPAPKVSDGDDTTPPAPTCTPVSGSVFPTGTTTVTCTATDFDDTPSTVSTSFTVTVTGAAAQLSDLHQSVQGIGPGTSLSDKVTDAQSYLAAGNVPDTCTTLTAFTNQVRAQSGKAIPSAAASTLTGDAQRIRAVLGC